VARRKLWSRDPAPPADAQPGALPWARLDELLTGIPAEVLAPRVAVISRSAEHEVLGQLAALAPRATITLHRLPLPNGELHDRLVVAGPHDLVLDLAGGPGLRRRFADVVWLVRRGGTVLVRLPEAPDAPARPFFERLAADHADPDSARPQPFPGLKPRHRRALLRGLDRLELDEGWVTARLGTDALPKIGPQAVAGFLAGNPAAGATLLTLPAESWPVTSAVRTSRPLPRNDLPTSYDAPAAGLRDYRDAVVMPGRAAWVDTGVLPESFRFQRRPELRNAELQELAPRFVARPPEPEERLPGVWFNLTSPLPHHFGHALTEQLSHAWGWAEARSRHPELRALVATKPERRLAPWELELLAAAGIPRDLVTEVTHPVRVERLLDTSALYEIGGFVHPRMRELYDEVGARLAAGATSTDRPARLFHTRRSAKRRCRNQSEVEAMFEAAGFVVVAPEDSPLPDQVARVRAAEVVAGFAGSGMFHVALAARPQHVVVITQEGYPAHNEYQLSALLGHRLDLAVCPPDVPRTEPGYQRSAFHSDFVVDPATEGAFLRSVLDELGPARGGVV